MAKLRCCDEPRLLDSCCLLVGGGTRKAGSLGEAAIALIQPSPFLHNSVEDNLWLGEEADAWAKPTYIMTRSHQNKLFPFHHHLSSQLFHYCPALSFCQHKKNTIMR